MLNRINSLRELFSQESIDAFLITRPENRFYLTGFTGTSGAVLLTGDDIFLITDFRYDEQAREESPHCRVIMISGSLFDVLNELSINHSFGHLGCEGDFMTQQQFRSLEGELKNLEVKPLNGLVEQLRLIKDEQEIKLIGDAVSLSDKAFNHIQPFIREGAIERELALEIEFIMRKSGAEGIAFSFIVASGFRSAMPHGTASEKRLQKGELLIMDFGALLKGYHSDITRTVAVGQADQKMLDLYKVVLEAQLAGIHAVREGVLASEVDKAARDVISGYGYGENFGHSTGHGLGLQIHENPRVSSQDHTVLKKGMVVTVEPGIYLSGWGGIRIEDTVVVEERGCRILTSSPKDKLIVCG